MFYQLTKLRGYSIGAVDGEIGSVRDVYFDDEWWGVRYFVVKTGGWLSGREVLISPRAVRPGAWSDGVIPVDLTREQVETSPPVETERPVSRHYEMAHAAHYRNDYYWNGPHSWAAGPFGTVLGTAQPRPGEQGREMELVAESEHQAAEVSHLRSASEVIGYEIEATDGTIGQVDDFLVESATWRIAHLVVDKQKWLPGGRVLVAVEAIDHVDWSSSSVRLKMTRDEVKGSPEYP